MNTENDRSIIMGGAGDDDVFWREDGVLLTGADARARIDAYLKTDNSIIRGGGDEKILRSADDQIQAKGLRADRFKMAVAVALLLALVAATVYFSS